MLLAQLLPQHARNFLTIIHFLVEHFDAAPNIESAPHLIIITFEPQLVTGVPKKVRERVGKLGVKIQLSAYAKELACLLQDKGA